MTAGLAALDAAAAGPWLFGAGPTHADVAAACGMLAIRADLPHLAPPGRFARLDALVRAAEALPAFAATAA